jgi:hypothetical protein
VKLWGRKSFLKVGTIGIPSDDSLRVAFTVAKNLKPDPDKASFQVWNLNEDHINEMNSAPYQPLQFDAGYEEKTSTIFLGKVRTGGTIRQDANLVTSFEAGDGEQEAKTSRVNVSIAKGTNTDQVLKQVALAVGVGKGNLDDAARKIRSAFSGTGNIFSMGTVLSGCARDELTHICNSLNLDWSIKGEKLQILEKGKALEGKAIFLGGLNGRGMIGEPTVDAKGVMTVSCFLQPDVFPGRLVVVDGKRVKGQYRIEETVHSGDTHSTSAEWTIEIKGKKY